MCVSVFSCSFKHFNLHCIKNFFNLNIKLVY